MRPASRPPALVTELTAYGTLAAVRCLGQAGVPVTVAGPEALAPSRWSRHVTRRVHAPGPDDPERHVAWLLEFGAEQPGHVLYPTSDDGAWLLAFHGEELARHYRLYQPPFATIRRLLDKRLLAEACASVGIRTPPSVFPEAQEAIDEVAARASFPLLLKPRLQVLHRTHAKGRLVPSPAALPSAYRAHAAQAVFHPWLATRFPEVLLPMLQSYLPRALDEIYTIAGFVDGHGEIVALAARKILQRPRRLGIGVCFEAAPLDAALLARLRALCLATGYHGVFEAEFVDAGGVAHLIDFNPRFYSQMAFDVGRGLPLPLLAYEHAVGEDATWRAVRSRSDAQASARVAAYTHWLLFEVLMRGQRLSRGMTRAEVRAWRAWQRAHRAGTVDAVLDRGDPLPAALAYLTFLYGCMRHPRSALQTYVRGL